MRVCTSAALLILSLCTFSVLPAASQESQPEMVLPQTVHDFGQVLQGTVVQHEFELVNTGSSPLKIRKIHAACGCTAAMLDTDLIEPGGKALLRTSFDTTGFRGEKVKTIRIYTNDPKYTSAVFTIRGLVKPQVWFEPAAIDFGVVNKGQSAERKVLLRIGAESGVEVRAVNSRSDSVELERLSVDDNAQEFLLRLSDELGVGAFRGRIAAKTSSKTAPVVNLPVMARIVGDLVLTPSAASFGLLTAPLTEKKQIEVTLENRGPHKISIESVESSDQAVSVKWSVIEQGKKFSLLVQLNPSATGILRARILVKTNHPDEEQRVVTLPMYAIINKDEEG